jgi:hypothetical protein
MRWARQTYISPKRGFCSADEDSLDFMVLGREHFDTVYTYGLEGIHRLSFNSFFWVASKSNSRCFGSHYHVNFVGYSPHSHVHARIK